VGVGVDHPELVDLGGCEHGGSLLHYLWLA